MRLGSITLILGPKSRVCYGSSHPPNKFKSVSSAGKVMTSNLRNSKGVIMEDYLEEGRTINDAYYAEQSGCIRRL